MFTKLYKTINSLTQSYTIVLFKLQPLISEGKEQLYVLTVEDIEKAMRKAAAKQDFLEAARLRDVMFGLKAIYVEKF